MNHDGVRAQTRPLSVARGATWLQELAVVVRSLWPSLPIVVVGFAALLGCDTTERRDAAQRPNIVLILGDDHGYPDFGFMGSPIVQTPNLDRLASEGTFFDSGFVTSSVCLPSHRSLLTGLHPLQSRRRLSQSDGRDDASDLGESTSEFSTLPGLLAERGYATFQGGKLWEGSYVLAGFTHGTKGAESLSSSFAPSERTRGPNGFGQDILEAAAGGKAGLELGRTTMTPVYEFIDEHRDQPFFVWFAPLLPHSPFDAPEEFRALYRNPGLSRRTQGYYSNISWFDDAVGRLIAHLDAADLRQKTLVVYLADNGWQQGGVAMFDLGWGGNRGKGSMHELGLRTPIVFSWPGHIPEARVDHNLVSSVDLFSTLLDFAGARQPVGRPGVSLRGLLEGTSSKPPREVVIGSSEYLRVSEGPPRGAGVLLAEPVVALHLVLRSRAGPALQCGRRSRCDPRPLRRTLLGGLRAASKDPPLDRLDGRSHQRAAVTAHAGADGQPRKRTP
jgi:uncharacterized sulfatase